MSLKRDLSFPSHPYSTTAMDDERCEFGEPVVANDLVAVSDKLAGPLRVQRLKMKVAFWL